MIIRMLVSKIAVFIIEDKKNIIAPITSLLSSIMDLFLY